MEKILLIIGVNKDRTPVIKSLITYYQKKGVSIKIVQYTNSRFVFTIKSFALLFKRYRAIFFIGIQTLPILFMGQIISKFRRYIYWSLESYSVNDGNSFVIQLLWLQYLINWRYITLLLPVEERLEYHNHLKYKEVCIFPNVPNNGISFIKRSIVKNNPISLVVYGSLDFDKTYLMDIIEFVRNKQGKFSLDIIGKSEIVETKVRYIPNIYYHGLLDHDSLIQILKKSFHFSIIGYKPINFNTLNCAPNKLYESMSLSLPVIANSINPTLNRIVSQTNVGICINFKEFNLTLDYDKLIKYYSCYNINAYTSYSHTFNFEKITSKLNVCNLL